MRNRDLVVLLLILGVAVLLGSRLGDPLGVRPDSWSEAEVVVSGLGYASSGFLAYAGLPQHQIGPPVDPYFLYASYPVLSNLLYGLLHIVGADAHGLYRVPAVLSSLLAIGLWYRLLARLVDPTTAVASTVALASSFGFLAYADNIHQQAYPLAPQFGALLCLVVGTSADAKNRSRWLLGCAGCLLLVSLLTVELYLWLAIAIGGYVLLFGSAVPRRWLLLLAVPLCLGAALQALQGWIGSPVPAEDRTGFLENLYRRSVGFAEALDTPWDATGKQLSLATYPAFLLARFREFFLLPVWALLPLAAAGCAESGWPGWRPRHWPPQVKLLVILLAAGLGWMITMMQQTAVHPATMRQLLPFYALLLGTIWAQAVRAALDARRSPVWRCVAVLLGAGMLYPHCRSTWADVQMHVDHAYVHPFLGEAGWQESADLAALGGLPEGSVVLTNHDRLPLIRYWSRRPTYLAPNAFIRLADGQNRAELELAISYLRGLYRRELPRLLYLYRVPLRQRDSVRRAVADDQWLRTLTTGPESQNPSPEAALRAAAAYEGSAPSFCPILVRGSDWRVFDMTPALRLLMPFFERFPIPKLRDMPAPR